jgi:hypothetical protein
MAGVETASGRRSVAVFVLALVAVMAAIIFMGKLSRRHASQAPAAAPEAVAEPPAAPVAPPAPEAAEPPAAAVRAAATPVAASAPEAAPRQPNTQQQFQITRVVRDGRPGLEACYQRALVRDASLVHGNLSVRVAVAPSGHVDHVNITGPAAFRPLNPCLEAAVSRWTFPRADAPYETKFPLQLRVSE